MSRASDWAIAMGISDTNNEDQAALKPPFRGNNDTDI